MRNVFSNFERRLSFINLQKRFISINQRKFSSKSSNIKEKEELNRNNLKLSMLKVHNAIDIARQMNIPVEKYSLSRGLALNRFEKVYLKNILL